MNQGESSKRETPHILVVAHKDGGRTASWIDANDSAISIRIKIAEILPAPNEATAGQWAIKCYRGFGCIRLSEHEDIETVATIGQGISKYGVIFAEITARLGPYDAEHWMAYAYRGAFENIAEYAKKVSEEIYRERLAALPSNVTDYIDYAAMGTGMEHDRAITTIPLWGKIHVFVGIF